MAESLHQFFLIKATSKYTGHIHYVKVDDDDCVELHNIQVNASLFNTREQAEQAIKKYCKGEKTHTYIVDTVIMSLEEFMTEH